MSALKRSKDRKVTNGVSPNGKTATIANAFGLPSGKAFSCPGATSVCEKVCYAGKLEKIYSGVRNVLIENWEILTGSDRQEMARLLGIMIDEFRADCDKADAKNARKGIAPVERAFRVHWDGDFYSLDYARAWIDVIEDNPDITFWVYTRSFRNDSLNVLPLFDAMADRGNLALYLSVDSDNFTDAVNARKQFPWARWAYLSETFASGRDEMANGGVSGKAYNCPENKGAIPLISEKGSACIRCGICPTARGDVLFSIRKR